MKVTQADLQTALASIRGREVLAIDTETTGLSETDRAFAVIVATSTDVWYFDERLCAGCFNELAPILNGHPFRVAMQNAKFDMRMLATVGIHLIGNIYDITSLARLVRNDYMEYNLASQAKRFGKAKTDDVIKAYIKEHNLFEERINFFGETDKQPRYDWVPVDMMAEYAENDARLTFDLYQHYVQQLDDNELILAAGEAELNKVCYQMERIGMKVDTQKVFEAMSFEGEIVDDTLAKYLATTGMHYVNSAKALQKVLTVQLPLTEKGNPSADAPTLELILAMPNVLEKDKQIINLVLTIRNYEKRISTYYRNYLIMKDKHDVIHPQMWIAGTKTGRFSYSEPNLQNISKDDPDDPSPEVYSVRECFVPREGRVFISLDYSQMEYRMAADYAGEHGVIEAVMGGADFHQATADMVGINRKPAKTLNFAVLYGAGIDKIASMLKTTAVAAKQLKTKYFMNLHKIERLIDGVISTGKSRGFVFNWAHRKLYAEKDFAYALPNHLIQGGGADVVKEAMRRIWRIPHLRELWLVLQVHDQLVFELLPEELIHVAEIKEIMESVYPAKNGMKLTVDVSISYKSLAEKHMEKYNVREDRHATL